MSHNTAVISAFPACGKTYAFNTITDLVILDSDSSEFSWVKDEDGNNTTTRNPEFPANYIAHIKDNIGKADVIFVSSHKEVLLAMEATGIEFSMVQPAHYMKDVWAERMRARGNNEAFVKKIIDNWDDFLDISYLKRQPLTLTKLNKSIPYIAHDTTILTICMHIIRNIAETKRESGESNESEN